MASNTDTDTEALAQLRDDWLLPSTATGQPESAQHVARDERQWQLLPDVTTRQLVTVAMFMAAIAYIAVAILAFTLLVTVPIGRTLAVEVAVAGLSGGGVSGLVGLTVWSLLRRRQRADS